MKIVLDLKLDKEPNDNDIIVCKKGRWIVIPRDSFVAPYVEEQRKKNLAFGEEIKKLKEDLVSLAKIVKEK